MSTVADINAALRRLREENDRLRDALEECAEWFDQRADAEAVGDPQRYVGNAEMTMLGTCKRALAAAPATGDRWDAPEGRTHYDVAHAVALKDAELEVLAATRDYFDDKPGAFSRLAIANAALRALEAGPPIDWDGPKRESDTP